MKNLPFLFLFVFVICLVFYACGGDENGYDVGLVITTAGLGDRSFNDQGKQGLDRAQEEQGVGGTLYQPASEDDYDNVLGQAASDNNLTIALGYSAKDAVERAAAVLPYSKFVIIDAIVDEPNVTSVVFKEEQGSFLMGALAALKSSRGKIGFIGGEESEVIKRFEAGYRAGAAYINPRITVLVRYAGSFSDPDRGKQLAFDEYDRGADVIFHASGGTGLGVFEAARLKGPGHWVIGVDADQSDLAPDNTLSSLLKRVDVAIFNTIKTTRERGLQPGVAIYDLSNEGLSLAPTTNVNVSQEIIDRLDEIKTLIVNGEITVPTAP